MKTAIRGQGALEYLMTYGWAILVVMAIGAIMWQLGIFDLANTTTSSSSGFPRLKPILPMVKMETSGDFQGIFMNSAGNPIMINTPITANSREVSCTITHPAGEIVNAEQFELNGTCPGVSGNMGDSFEINIIISYNMTFGVSSLTHTDKGKIIGPLE